MMETVKALRDAMDVASAATQAPALEKRIAELEEFVRDLMAAHGPGALASEELFERGVALVRTFQR